MMFSQKINLLFKVAYDVLVYIFFLIDPLAGRAFVIFFGGNHFIEQTIPSLTTHPLSFSCWEAIDDAAKLRLT